MGTDLTSSNWQASKLQATNLQEAKLHDTCLLEANAQDTSLQAAAFHNFVNFLCFARCNVLAKEAASKEDCPIACLLISKLVLKTWQEQLKLADYMLITAFNNLSESIRYELVMRTTFNNTASNNMSSMQQLAPAANELNGKFFSSPDKSSLASSLNSNTDNSLDGNINSDLDLGRLSKLLTTFIALDKLEIANQREARQDIFGHCECLILNQASEKYQTRRFHDYIIYVNVEPCLLCASALVAAQVGELYFLAKNDKAGAICSKINLLDLPWLNHHVTWLKCDLPYLTKSTSKGLQDFFTKLRSRNKGYGSKQQRKQIYKETNKLDFYKSNCT